MWRFVAGRVNAGGPSPVALSRERAKAPYSEAQIAAWLGLVDPQATPGRRMRAQALICLGAGRGDGRRSAPGARDRRCGLPRRAVVVVAGGAGLEPATS